MDVTTGLGMVVAVAALIVSVFMEGGHLSSLFNPSALVIILGGTLGATVMSYSPGELARVPSLLAAAFFGRDPPMAEVIDTLVGYAEKARREGLLVLQEYVHEGDDPFLVRGLNLVIDGADPEAVRSILETDLAVKEKEYQTEAGIFETAGGYAPTMGIIGTVMGLVHVLGNLQDTSRLGPAIAVAFLATFYGIASANLIWLPIAAKLKLRARKMVAQKELMLEGILSIQAGENPRMVREKLEVFWRKVAREARTRAVQGEEAA
ncbi:MAG: flagellar motor protein [Firmicutes bacterium]|nr:flagellar motor protein [Bacillota bacterium]